MHVYEKAVQTYEGPLRKIKNIKDAPRTFVHLEFNSGTDGSPPCYIASVLSSTVVAPSFAVGPECDWEHVFPAQEQGNLFSLFLVTILFPRYNKPRSTSAWRFANLFPKEKIYPSDFLLKVLSSNSEAF